MAEQDHPSSKTAPPNYAQELTALENRFEQLSTEAGRLNALVAQHPFRPSPTQDGTDEASFDAALEQWEKDFSNSNETKLNAVTIQIDRIHSRAAELEKIITRDSQKKHDAQVHKAVFDITDALCRGREDEVAAALRKADEQCTSVICPTTFDRALEIYAKPSAETNSAGLRTTTESWFGDSGTPYLKKYSYLDDYLSTSSAEGAGFRIRTLLQENAEILPGLIVPTNGAFTQQHRQAIVQNASQAAHDEGLLALAIEARKGNARLDESATTDFCEQYTVFKTTGVYDMLAKYINDQAPQAVVVKQSVAAPATNGGAFTLTGERMPGHVEMLFTSGADTALYLPRAQDAVQRFNAIHSGGQVDIVPGAQENQYVLRVSGEVDTKTLLNFVRHRLDTDSPAIEVPKTQNIAAAQALDTAIISAP